MPHANIVRSQISTYTKGTATIHAIVPEDLATIYNVNLVFSGGNTGQRVTVVVIEDKATSKAPRTGRPSAPSSALRASPPAASCRPIPRAPRPAPIPAASAARRTKFSTWTRNGRAPRQAVRRAIASWRAAATRRSSAASWRSKAAAAIAEWMGADLSAARALGRLHRPRARRQPAPAGLSVRRHLRHQ